MLIPTHINIIMRHSKFLTNDHWNLFLMSPQKPIPKSQYQYPKANTQKPIPNPLKVHLELPKTHHVEANFIYVPIFAPKKNVSGGFRSLYLRLIRPTL